MITPIPIARSGTIASGQVGWPHHSSGAVRSGHAGNASVVSGSIASGQVGFSHLADSSVLSGTVGSGQIASGHLASGLLANLTPSLLSGSVQSGHIASGSVQGFFGATRHIASGTVGVWDFGSGAVLSGSIASGQVGFRHLANASVMSGTIASGQVFTFHIASGGLLSGAIGSGQIGRFHIASGRLEGFELGSGSVVSGRIASGQVGFGHLADGSVQSGTIASGQIDSYHFTSGATVSRSQYVEWAASGLIGGFITAEIISGVRAVTLNQSGALIIAMASISGRYPAIGAVVDNVLSGIQPNVYSHGPIFQVTSGLANYSGWLGRHVILGRSGHLVSMSGSFNSGGLLSGDVYQPLGIAVNSGAFTLNVAGSLEVSPDRQQMHPSAAKAWICFTGTGTVTINISYNVSSLVDSGVGDYLINWDVDFAGANSYSWIAGGDISLSATNNTGPIPNQLVKAADNLELQFLNSAASATDWETVNVLAFGVQ